MINAPKNTNKSAWQDNSWGICPSLAHKREQTLNFLHVEGLIQYSLPIMALLLIFLSSAANAGDVAKPYHIPAQPLSSALLQFAEDSKLELIVKADKLRGFNAVGLDGKLTSAQALSRMLQGSGMTYRFVDANTVTIDAASNNLIKTASTGQVTESQTGGEGQMMPKVTVEAESSNPYDDPAWDTSPENNDYYRPNATTATKISAPLKDLPHSIQVIPRKLIEDRQTIRLNELGETVSGVTKFPGYGGLSSSGFFVRGFNLRGESLRNGFRDYGFLSPREVANAERVEFLKGPASVLYGGGVFGLGGVVNTVTKKPLNSPYYQGSMVFGNYDLYRPSFDVTGPLGKDIPLSYRLNFVYENGNSFRDFTENEKFFVAPSLIWQISPNTKFTLEFDHQRDDFTHDLGLPFEPESLKLPINRFLGAPGFNRANIDGNSVTYNLEHQFNDNWRFRQGFNANLSDGTIDTTYYYGGFEPGSRRLLTREADRSFERQENFALQNELYGKFSTGPVKHNFMVGAELARFNFDYDFFAAPIASIDIFNPTYNTQVGPLSPSFAGGYGSDNFGIYTQDLMTLLPNLKLLFGGRYDWVDFEERTEGVVSLKKGDDHFSPRVGLVYQPFNDTSLYFSWGNSFNPNFRTFLRPKIGSQFKPETAEQFEFGIKQEFFDNRFMATLAFYHLARQNLLTRDLSDTTPSDGIDQIQTGEQRSQGIEFDLAGEILPGWNITAAYAYTDAVVTKDDNGLQGATLVNAPKHSGSLWTTYEIQNGVLKGLGFGGGIIYKGSREATLPHTITLEDYVRADASVFYNWDKFRFALNLKNINDVKTYNSGGDFLIPEPPLTVLGTISVKY